jgi:chorismate synthase
VIVRAVMKPISTITRPLASVDIVTKEAKKAFKERSDVCAVPAAAVVGEAAVAFVLAQALVEKFGGDTLSEIEAAVDRYRSEITA